MCEKKSKVAEAGVDLRLNGSYNYRVVMTIMTRLQFHDCLPCIKNKKKEVEMKAQRFLAVLVGALYCACTWAGDGSGDVKGLWMTADKDAVLRLEGCQSKSDSLCAHIVWVKDADSTSDCGVQILQLDSYDGNAWRNGWVYDPRDHKKYKGIVRLKDGYLNMRAFVGTEVLGKTEQFEKVEQLPPTQVCKS